MGVMAKTWVLHQRHEPTLRDLLWLVRGAESDHPSEAEMVRRLIVRAADSVRASKGEKGPHDDGVAGRQGAGG